MDISPDVSIAPFTNYVFTFVLFLVHMWNGSWALAFLWVMLRMASTGRMFPVILYLVGWRSSLTIARALSTVARFECGFMLIANQVVDIPL